MYYLHSKCVEPAEYVGCLFDSLSGGQFTLPTLCEFGRHLYTRSILHEGLQGFLQSSNIRSDQRLAGIRYR